MKITQNHSLSVNYRNYHFNWTNYRVVYAYLSKLSRRDVFPQMYCHELRDRDIKDHNNTFLLYLLTNDDEKTENR